MSFVLAVNSRWDWQILHWASATHLFLDGVTFVMIFIATTSIKFYVRCVLNIRSMQPIKLWLELNEVRLVGIVVSGWALEWIFLEILSISVCSLAIHRPNSVHVWTVLVSTFISRLSLKFCVWSYIRGLR